MIANRSRWNAWNISKRIKAHQTPWVALHILGRLVVGSPAQTLLPSSPSQASSPSHHDHQCHQHHQHHHHIMISNIINMIIYCICIYFEQVSSGVSSLPSFPSQTMPWDHLSSFWEIFTPGFKSWKNWILLNLNYHTPSHRSMWDILRWTRLSLPYRPRSAFQPNRSPHS